MTVTRRAFVRWLLGGGALIAGAIAGLWTLLSRKSAPIAETSPAADGAAPRHALPDASAPRRTLSEPARRFSEAVAARLVPAVDGPGAREAGVAEFIDRQMADPSFRVFRDEIEEGAKRYAALATLPEGEQDAVVARMQSDDGHLFQVLLTLTLEGMFADPAHGGNRKCAGWRLLGVRKQECHPT